MAKTSSKTPPKTPLKAPGKTTPPPEKGGEKEKKAPEVAEMKLEELNTKLEEVKTDVENKYNRLIGYYEQHRAGKIRFSPETLLKIEGIIEGLAKDFEKEKGKEKLAGHARTTIEAMMDERKAGIGEYIGLVTDDLMRDLKNNPMGFMTALGTAFSKIWGKLMGTDKTTYKALPSAEAAETSKEKKKSKTEVAPTIDVTKAQGVTLSTNGLMVGNYRFDKNGNVFTGKEPVAQSSVPENLRHLSAYLKRNHARLHYLNNEIDSSTPLHSHYKVAFLAVRMQQMSKFQGHDALTFLESYLVKEELPGDESLLSEFEWGSTAGRRGPEQIAAIGTWLSSAADWVTDIIADYGTETGNRHDTLNLIVENMDRLGRWVNDQDIAAMMKEKEAREIKSELGWAIAPTPSWSEGSDKMSFPGDFTMDVTGNVFIKGIAAPKDTKLPPGLKEIQKFVQDNQGKLTILADKIDPGNAQDVAGLRMPAIVCALRLQLHINKSEKTEKNAFDFLIKNWGGSEAEFIIGDTGIYNEYSEGVGESLEEGVGFAVAGAVFGGGASWYISAALAIPGAIIGGVVGLVNEAGELIDDMISFEETNSRQMLTKKMPEDNYERLLKYYDTIA